MGVAYSMVQHASLITAPSIKPHAKCQSFSFRYKTYIYIPRVLIRLTRRVPLVKPELPTLPMVSVSLHVLRLLPPLKLIAMI
jgi:hypothetical protein